MHSPCIAQHPVILSLNRKLLSIVIIVDTRSPSTVIVYCWGCRV